MLEKELQLKTRIMRRVYFIWFIRKAFNSLSLRIFSLLALFYVMLSQVSVFNVLNNFPKSFDLSQDYNFISSAVLNTEIAVQFSLLGISILFVWLFKDVFNKNKNVAYGWI